MHISNRFHPGFEDDDETHVEETKVEKPDGEEWACSSQLVPTDIKKIDRREDTDEDHQHKDLESGLRAQSTSTEKVPNQRDETSEKDQDEGKCQSQRESHVHLDTYELNKLERARLS